MADRDPAMERARMQVKQTRDFFYHFMVFAFVNIILVIVDRAQGANDVFLGMDWAFWVILAWGLGLVGHAIYAFFGERRVRKVYDEEKAREFANR